MTKWPTKKVAKKKTKTRSVGKTRWPASAKARARSRKAAPNAEPPDVLTTFVDAAAAALDLPIDPAWRAAVKINLDIILKQGALFADFELPDDAEPAPVFKA